MKQFHYARLPSLICTSLILGRFSSSFEYVIDEALRLTGGDIYFLIRGRDHTYISQKPMTCANSIYWLYTRYVWFLRTQYLKNAPFNNLVISDNYVPWHQLASNFFPRSLVICDVIYDVIYEKMRFYQYLINVIHSDNQI